MTSSVDGSVEPRLSVVIAVFNEENNLPVYLCTQPHVSPIDAWKTVKHFG